MAKKRSKTASQEKVFVRGADGSLYVVSKNKAPIKLSKKDAEALTRILEEAGERLSECLKDEIPALGSGVNIPLPNIFQ